MKASVLMPFRDAEPWIAAAEDSVLNQGGLDFELIAIDDGAKDGSRSILSTYRDARLRVVENRGPAGIVGALETGRVLAGGDWLIRMDADDVALPDRFRLQADRAMAADSPDVVACRVELLNPLGDGMQAYVNWTNELLDPEAIGHRRFVESPVIHPSAMIRAAALEEIGGYRDVGWAEDHDLWLRLLARGRRVVKLPQVLLRWRDSDRRLTRVDPRYGREARTAMRGHFLARLPAVADRGVCLAGAGPIGKSLARCLLAEGVAVAGFFEVHRGRIGQRIHGLPVADSAQLAERWRDRVLLGAVGLPGRREWIRRLALESGRVEGEDFWSVC